MTDVIARQRYPWNGLIDIDYTIVGDASGLGVLIKMIDKETGLSYYPTKFYEVLSTGEGRHRVTWSTAAEGLTNLVTRRMVASVALMRVLDAPVVTNDLYLVIDLSNGPTATNYPVSYLADVPNGGVWPEEYKTTKLVLRKIPAGSINGVSISEPFYCGVFEVTQRQYELIMGEKTLAFTYFPGDMRAVSYVSYNMIRGELVGAEWPKSCDVDATSFLWKIRARSGLLGLDLPTVAQWEYACRAGTTSDYNNGGSTEDDLRTLGRYSGNQDDGRGGCTGIGQTSVGSYAPNSWGLYDMHGNVFEWCRDYAYGDVSGIDPLGPSSGQCRELRGGSWDRGAAACKSSSRSTNLGVPSYNYMDFGFRLYCSTGL